MLTDLQHLHLDARGHDRPEAAEGSREERADEIGEQHDGHIRAGRQVGKGIVSAFIRNRVPVYPRRHLGNRNLSAGDSRAAANTLTST